MRDFNHIITGPIYLEGVHESFLAPDEYAGEVLNMFKTPDGSLRSVRGPVEYHPAEWLDNDATLALPSDTDYSLEALGLHHAVVNGYDVLLRHQGNNIFVHNGPTRSWRGLLGTNPSAQLTVEAFGDLVNDASGTYLTQFITVPGGVVIVPQGLQAYFYDGEKVAPLGYSSAPGAPRGLGPSRGYEDYASSGVFGDVANSVGYVHTGRTPPEVFGNGRMGSLDSTVIDVASGGNKSNPLGAVLQAGSVQAAVQWVDCWGNLSAAGPRSAAVDFAKQDNLTKERGKDAPEDGERLRVQVAWTGIARGPERTVGRILLRTKDLLNSGTAQLFEVPAHPGGGALFDFATIPDNICTLYPDNVPDTWLLQTALPVAPMPIFKVGFLAFGRLWMCQLAGAPGQIIASHPGRWGTPDPTTRRTVGSGEHEVVAGLAVAGGALVLTSRAAFLLTLNDSGDGFKVTSLSATGGCVSPNTVAVLPESGAAVWLGPDGFYGYDGQQVKAIDAPVRRRTTHINWGRARRAVAAVDPVTREYRCWVPTGNSSKNNYCYVFDAGVWRFYDYIQADAVCVTSDSRRYMLALGRVVCDRSNPDDAAGDFTNTLTPSLWVLDHAGNGILSPSRRTAKIITGWFKTHRTHRRSAPQRLLMQLRERGPGTLTVRAHRDYRPEAVQTEQGLPRYPDDDPPDFLGQVTMGSSVAKDKLTHLPRARRWALSRPSWQKVDLHVPGAETFALTIEGEGDWEVMGIGVEETSAHNGGANIPRGS